MAILSCGVCQNTGKVNGLACGYCGGECNYADPVLGTGGSRVEGPAAVVLCTREEYIAYINSRTALLGLLYDLDLMPEQVEAGSEDDERMLKIADHFSAAEEDLRAEFRNAANPVFRAGDAETPCPHCGTQGGHSNIFMHGGNTVVPCRFPHPAPVAGDAHVISGEAADEICRLLKRASSASWLEEATVLIDKALDLIPFDPDDPHYAARVAAMKLRETPGVGVSDTPTGERRCPTCGTTLSPTHLLTGVRHG